MAATNINRVIITGNLTRDPELRSLPSGTTGLRACGSPSTRAARTRAAIGSTSPTTSTSRSGAPRARTARPTWRRAARSPIDGRLDWREWEGQDGEKRQAVEIIADRVQFLGSRDGAGEQSGGNRFNAQSDVPADTSDFDSPAPAAVGASDDDIPF